MNALRVVLLTVLLALLPLQGWAAMGDATTFTTMLGHCPDEQGQALMTASRTGMSAADLQQAKPQHYLDALERSWSMTPDVRLSHPVAGHALCPVPCGIALAMASTSLAWHIVQSSAPMPEFHTRLVASAAPDAPYHPPRV
ncbi:conserved exported hypothetical protein [Thiomonas arsenitoxydans]|uniref:Secreted protein n=1 Tax=Thiomonas arsenitoxydans (strain DSM 22701 / CIP 110005 / 3As) TaxID=426114 RepID=D6CMA6_THIA3|nr:hypothetical protein [Thiomonas arsenitoxydans]CAZ89684.1 hypothetical protein; putative exported protein [Thiomonas arsenitoxydans]CQR31302.1 conserved exported hypothetical protein [Thiomonas arsenitoxydans]CQR35983.1 conserved exported hypothetical protein [Thiomonas arsenitoxydans]CQR39123.1 conserved exported hypothetical protein [Thiomonas arsenitoxydans]CQR39220.1 conserved exported hypothetical protein [Thiomonas arsenitoxydans]